MGEPSLNDGNSVLKKELSMKNIDSRTILLSALSGGMSGLLTELVYFPLDSIKTRIQATTKRNNFVKQSEKMSKMKGASIIIIVSVPNTMIFFLFYNKLKQQLSQNTSLHPVLIHMSSAALAESIKGIFRNPFEVIKQQMQVGWNPTIRLTSREIYNLNGISGFFAGYTTLILREIPFSMIGFSIYEYMRKRALREKQELSLLDNIKGGSVAGATAAFLTNPIDVVKTRLMTQRDKYYANTFNCIKSIYREEGLNGFTRGICIRTPAVGFSSVIFFAIYENVKSGLDKILPNF